jgi:hypothetical protein
MSNEYPFHAARPTLVGAIIRIKAHASLDGKPSTWRVEHGQRMRYVQGAIGHALATGRNVGHRNSTGGTGNGPTFLLARVVRL